MLKRKFSLGRSGSPSIEKGNPPPAGETTTIKSTNTKAELDESKPVPKYRAFLVLNQLSGTYARAKQRQKRSCLTADCDEDHVLTFLRATFPEDQWLLAVYTIDRPSQANLHASPEFLSLIVRASNEFDFIFVGGGDGTVASCLSVVANAIRHFGAKRTPVGIIPLGTGNMIAQELGLSADWKKASQQLAALATSRDGMPSSPSGRPRSPKSARPLTVKSIDALRIGERHHFLNVDIGAGSKMIELLNDAAKHKWGKMAYVMNTMKILANHKPVRYLVTIDNNPPTELCASELVIANAGAVGIGGRDQRWGPGIAIDDGIANFVAVRATGFASYMHVMWMLYSRKTAKFREKLIRKNSKSSASQSSSMSNPSSRRGSTSSIGSEEAREEMASVAAATAAKLATPGAAEQVINAEADGSLLQHSLKLPHFQFREAVQSIRVDLLDCCAGTMPVQADGDLIGTLPITIDVVRAAVDVLAGN